MQSVSSDASQGPAPETPTRAAPPVLVPDTATSAPLVLDTSAMAVGVARPLPVYWPNVHLPTAALLAQLPIAVSNAVAAAEAVEQDSWHLLVPTRYNEASMRTPSKKKRGQAMTAKRMQHREAANEQGTLCKCGKLDTEKFMLQCDGCDVWFHGECVGLTQEQCLRARRWHCRACTRRHVAAQARCTVYCHCRGPWDGRSFMIQCDACDRWFHGACVGYAVQSAQQCTEAAFRRYNCPHCMHAAEGRRAAVAAVGAWSAKLVGKRKATCCLELHAPATPAASTAPNTHSTVAHADAGAWTDGDGWKLSPAEGSRVDDAGEGSSSLPTCAGPADTLRDSSPTLRTAHPPSASTSLSLASPAASPAAAAARPPCLLLTRLDEDALASILEALAPPHAALLRVRTLLLSVAPTCRRLATLAEPHFRRFGEAQRWRPPRRTRDHPFAWRLLLRQRACAVCLEPHASFPVRRQGGGASGGCPLLFRLCRQCARRDKVQQQVQWHGLEVDAIDEQGKALFARQFHIPLFGHANGFSTNLDVKINRSGL